MRLLPSLAMVVLALLVSGCAGGPVPTSSTPAPTDSLQAEISRLQDRNRSLRDSLRFRKDVDSGQYYRELRTLQDRLTRLTYEVRLLRDGGMAVTILPADSLFESASATITAPGAERLKALADQLQTTYPNRTVRVEGYADNTPLSGSLQEKYPSNWELSSARATAVVRHLIDLTSLDRGQFVAVGYGSTRPRASNETARGRQQNRRVRVTVLPVARDYSPPSETSW